MFILHILAHYSLVYIAMYILFLLFFLIYLPEIYHYYIKHISCILNKYIYINKHKTFPFLVQISSGSVLDQFWICLLNCKHATLLNQLTDEDIRQ